MLRKDHRPDVRRFDWEKHRTQEPFAQMWKAALTLQDARDSAIAKASALNRSPDFTPTGRSNAKRDYATQVVAPVLKDALRAIKLADENMERIRSTMAPKPLDKADLAGALKRQEIRGWLRSLSDSKRVSMLMGPDKINPDIAAAIIEQPAELSGVTEKLRASLQFRAHAAQYPEEARTMDLIDQAQETLDRALQSSVTELRSQLEVPELAELAGIAPSHAEKLSEILNQGGEQT